MEIKRELAIGELNSVKKAVLPIGAAVGGMIVPALIYFLLNHGTAGVSGWGIPMATDIAFALAALSLFGSKRAPQGLVVFLTALATVDDLGAILVIAVFYTEKVSLMALLVAGVVLTALIMANKSGRKSVSIYLLLGIVLWVALLKSGIHATIAGVLLGMTIPAKSAKGSKQSVLSRLEHALQPWVAFGIMPVFAFTNAGVPLDVSRLRELVVSPVSIGIIAGLFLGKQMGIFGTTYIVTKLKLASLPRKVTLRQFFGAGVLSGIGFTMSIFIATLAFRNNDLLAIAKISIILASIISAVVGFVLLSIESKTLKQT